jgi:hypothetical protein
MLICDIAHAFLESFNLGGQSLGSTAALQNSNFLAFNEIEIDRGA